MSVQAVKKGEFPNFKPGDTVRVHLRVVEGDSERVQVFEGVVIRRRGAGISESFTVRKISFGVGVERTVPLHSPRVQKIELAKTGRARRARLYYLRNLRGKAARLTEEERTRGDEGAQKGGTPDGAKPAAAAQEPAPAERAPRAEAAPA